MRHPQDDAKPAVRTDGGLFSVTDRPVIEHTTGSESPVVTGANQAFVDTFGITDGVVGVPLSTTLAAITDAGFDEREILDTVRSGVESSVQCAGETVDGTRQFEARIVQADGTGYVIFTEGDQDEGPDIVQYLTHSLRNPLEVARVHAELAQAGDDEAIETVERALERMEDIISDTAELARQVPSVEETEPVDVATVAREAWETVLTDEATLTIGSPGTVEANERRLRILFENLFRNAIRHGTPDDDGSSGDLTVTIDGMEAGFFLADDGDGIPVADRERVFDIGYSTEPEGTGLGLTIVAEVAERHGWTLTVAESDAGGTRFEFRTSATHR